jgi:hypothetical protein
MIIKNSGDFYSINIKNITYLSPDYSNGWSLLHLHFTGNSSFCLKFQTEEERKHTLKLIDDEIDKITIENVKL